MVIGLRFQVGPDWDQYNYGLLNSQGQVGSEIIRNFDPAYGLLTWLAVATGSGIWLVNTGCAIAFLSGLFAFCRRLSNPWLALVVALPYMVIVMPMNYTRQGAAFGFVLWALIALEEGRVRRFIALVAIAALFHKSAVVLMPLGALAVTRNWFWAFLWTCIASAVIYVLLLAESRDILFHTYLEDRMSSGGGGIRVAMNAAAALIYLGLRNRFDLDEARRSVWTRFAVLTLLFIPAIILSVSSTAVDRVALYFMPIQLLTLSHLPTIAKRPALSAALTYLVISAYAIVLFVWFKFSLFAYFFIPYRFYPFEL